MDEKALDLEKEKKEVELSLSRTLLTQIEKKTISYEDAQEVARFILLQIDDIKNSGQLLSFLQEMNQRWNIFETIYSLYKLRIGDSIESKKKLEIAESTLSQMIQQ